MFFAYGFRPFFLLAGVYALVPAAALYWALVAGQWPAGAPPLFSWHGHEMLFGFAGAAIAGFLLTAAPTWTGTRAVSGLPLIGLVSLWLAGRVVSSPWVSPDAVYAQLLGAAFFPVLAMTVAIPILRTRNFRNLPFIVLLAILFLGELAWHARFLGWLGEHTFDGLRLTINTIALMIVIVGGRITPAFTRNALIGMGRTVSIANRPAVDRATIASVAIVLAGDVLAADTILTGLLAAVAALLVLFRLSGWGGLQALDIPLLWVLHAGFCWLAIALALKAAWLLGGFAWAGQWMHAFTAGAFGTMILGVMTRVALGHTGRPLAVPWTITAAYVLVSVAAITRIFGPWLAPQYYTQVLAVSITAWTAAFVIFLAVYASILVKPRVDGKDG